MAKLEHMLGYRRGPIGLRLDVLAAMACWLQRRHGVRKLDARSLVASWAVGAGVWRVKLKTAREGIGGIPVRVDWIGRSGEEISLHLFVRGRFVVLSREYTVFEPFENRREGIPLGYRVGSTGPETMGDGTIMDLFRPPRAAASVPAAYRFVPYRKR